MLDLEFVVIDWVCIVVYCYFFDFYKVNSGKEDVLNNFSLGYYNVEKDIVI